MPTRLDLFVTLWFVREIIFCNIKLESMLSEWYTSFIRQGQLSDSAALDDNHDVTMDSTAFSMHFRSLARSESGVDFKTPTGVNLSFEEKTLRMRM